jgi:hypothetical protein
MESTGVYWKPLFGVLIKEVLTSTLAITLEE